MDYKENKIYNYSNDKKEENKKLIKLKIYNQKEISKIGSDILNKKSQNNEKKIKEENKLKKNDIISSKNKPLNINLFVFCPISLPILYIMPVIAQSTKNAPTTFSVRKDLHRF